MPPKLDKPPPAPTRKTSSSALLGAVRDFASGRGKLPIRSSHQSTTPTISTKQGGSAVAAGQRDDKPSNGVAQDQQSGSNNVLTGHVGNTKEEKSQNGGKRHSGPPFGGPPELQILVSKLTGDLPLGERILAARGIVPILEDYPIRDVSVLLDAATALLNVPQNGDAHKVAYDLLNSSAKYCDLTALERRTLFEAISATHDDGELAWRIDTIQSLTSGGRNTESCESDVVEVLTKLLEQSFGLVLAAKKGGRSRRRSAIIREKDNLHRAASLLHSLIKFNAKVFKQRDLESLSTLLVTICKKTTSESDIEMSVDVIDALITYTEVPQSVLRPCIEVLCDVYRQLLQFQEKTWRILKNLFGSHHSAAAVSTLLGILSEVTESPAPSTNPLRGAASVLRVLVTHHGEQDMPLVPLGDLLPAIQVALAVDNFKFVIDLLAILNQLLVNPELTELLFSENDWSIFTNVLLRCFKHYRAASEQSSSAADEPSSRVSANTRQLHGAGIYFSQITTTLNDLVPRMDMYQKDAVMGLFRQLDASLNDAAAEGMVRYYIDELLLYPFQDQYFELATSLLNTIFVDKKRPRHLRMLLIQGLTRVSPGTEQLYDRTGYEQYVELLLGFLKGEEDRVVLSHLGEFGAAVSVDISDEAFDKLFPMYEQALLKRRGALFTASEDLQTWNQLSPLPPEASRTSLCDILSRSVARIFLRTINVSAHKARRAYTSLIEIANTAEYEIDARITAMRVLFRIRADSTNAIYVSPNSESTSIARLLCRTIDTAVDGSASEPNQQRQARVEESSNKKDTRHTSSSSPHSSMSRFVTRSSSGPLRPSKPVPPCWMYPGPKGLPEEPVAAASSILFSDALLKNSRSESDGSLSGGQEKESGSPSEEIEPAQSSELLDVGKLMDLILNIMKQGSDWETYSYVIVHAAALLANHNLFSAVIPSVGAVQALTCEQIRTSSFQEPPAYTSLKRADVATCLYHILTTVMSYHSHFRKELHDEVVKVFALGITSWDRTSKWAIHALSICCHELPLSTSKCLDIILQRMSTIITQPQIAIHILEFLATLARMPELYKNLRDDDFKMVFGICFRYLQYVRDQHEKTLNAGNDRTTSQGASRNSAPARDTQANPDSEAKAAAKRSPADDLPQYVYSIAYHVITFWFLSLKLQDRQSYMGWITKSLTHFTSRGEPSIDEQSQVTIDFMQRVAFSNRDDTGQIADFAGPSDGEVNRKSWLVGTSIMTIETAARTGKSQITSRRPSGTHYSMYLPQITKPHAHQTTLSNDYEDATFSTDQINVLPDDVLQAFYSTVFLPGDGASISDYPTPLADDDATRRAISAFDRTPEVDSHKAGVIYIGEGQTTEAEIFANTSGSLDYTQFISNLGSLVELKGACINTHGLDREFGTDGDFTFAWRDRVTEMVFHVTTLMPTNLDDDPQCINKKKHTGNDYVNIIFNNSGQPFNFDMFPSAFNYVYIVIAPVSRSSPFHMKSAASRDNSSDTLYEIRVLSKPGFPEISSAAESKIMSARSLPGYTRYLALNASFFSHVWSTRDGADSISSWRNRLREIRRLRERQSATATRTGTSPPPPSSGYGSTSVSVAQSPQGQMVRDSIMSVGPFKRASAAVFGDSNSRSSMLSNPTDPDQQGSESMRN